jgi:AcrR family transcriptional regulator
MTPRRADAQRNRDRLLAAAREVFDEHGGGAPLDEIARRAGVGAGTVYRHFPSKEALLRAVLQVRLRELADRAESLAGAPDPGAALFEFAAHVVSESTAKHDLVDALAGEGSPVVTADLPETQDYVTALARLLERAQHAGAVRPDLTRPQLSKLLIGVSLAASRAPDLPDTLALVLDGLRPR